MSTPTPHPHLSFFRAAILQNAFKTLLENEFQLSGYRSSKIDEGERLCLILRKKPYKGWNSIIISYHCGTYYYRYSNFINGDAYERHPYPNKTYSVSQLLSKLELNYLTAECALIFDYSDEKLSKIKCSLIENPTIDLLPSSEKSIQVRLKKDIITKRGISNAIRINGCVGGGNFGSISLSYSYVDENGKVNIMDMIYYKSECPYFPNISTIIDKILNLSI